MAANSTFGSNTPGSDVVKAYSGSIKDKTILITGVSPNGLGETMAQLLASEAPKLLIMTARTPAKAEQVADSLKVPTKIVTMDVSSLKSVKEAASNVTDGIDIIINNAGVMNLPTRQLSADGLEMHLATNYMGPFLFTDLLISKMNKGGRVVNVASNGYAISPFRFHDYNFDDGSAIPDAEKPNKAVMDAFGLPYGLDYMPPVAYGQSKTAIILFTEELGRRLKSKDISTVSLNPGAIATDLWRQMPKEVVEQIFNMMPMKSRDEGSSTPLVAALDPDLSECTGCYLEDCQIQELLPFAKDEGIAGKLWQLSEQIVKKVVG